MPYAGIASGNAGVDTGSGQAPRRPRCHGRPGDSGIAASHVDAVFGGTE
jgi:hypothetical protein